MPLKVEAAVITRKGTSAQFNSDSININKKVLSREVAANGYKGAGTVSGKSFFALACAQVESCADAAVVSLNERTEQFLSDAADVQNVFSDFFKDITGALTEMGHNSSAFSCALFYADEQEVIVSQTGSVKCFRYSDEKLYFVDPILTDHSDALSQYGSCRFDDVKDGDLFFLLDENVADALNNELLEEICKQCAGNTKIAVKLLLSKVNSELNAGAFVLKVFKSEEKIVPAAVNVAESEEKPVAVQVVPENETETNETQEDYSEGTEKKSATSKALVCAIIAMLVVVLFVVGFFIGRYLKTVIGPAEDSQSVVEESQDTTVEETETTEETTEETTDDESTTDETTTEAESTTRKSTQASSGSVVTPTRAPETTTRKPAVTETTTKLVEKETTTVKSEESTTQEETATNAGETLPEATTVDSESTAQADTTETTDSVQTTTGE